MSEQEAWRILPQYPSPPGIGDAIGEFISNLVILAIWMLLPSVILLGLIVGFDDGRVYVMAGVWWLIGTSGLTGWSLRRTHDQQCRSADETAKEITTRLRATILEMDKSANEIRVLVKNSHAWLEHARKEFNAGAFAPFWDAIEKAAINLGGCRHKLDSISSTMLGYHARLNQLSHTFPLQPINVADLPDLRQVARALEIEVRQGQTDFQFAVIWEHRATRKAIVAGFSTLADAVDGLSTTISSSLDNLQVAMGSGFDGLSASQLEATGDRHAIAESTAVTAAVARRVERTLDKNEFS